MPQKGSKLKISEVERPSQLFQLNVQDRLLPLIESGQKTTEVRVNTGRFKDVQVGDRLQFNGRPDVIRLVTRRTEYSCIDVLLQVEDPSSIGPGFSTSEIAKVLHQIYPPAREVSGMVVFGLGMPGNKQEL